MRLTADIKHQIANDLGRLIKDYRKRKKMSQAVLSSRVKISRNYLSMIEGGKRFPSQFTLRKIGSISGFQPTCIILEAMGGETTNDKDHIISEILRKIYDLLTEVGDIKKLEKIASIFFK